jgi:hypothetical protein
MNLGSTSPINFNPTTSNIFYESWVYFLTLGSGGGGNQNDIINTGSFKVEVDSVGTIRVYFASTNTYYVPAGGASFWLNKWNHVAFSWNYSTSTMLIFVNGAPGTSGSGTIVYSSTTAVLLGCLYTNYGFINGYIRDLRVVQGGVVPTTSFTPGSAPFSYTLPSYVTGSGSVVFTLLGQFVTYVPGKFNQALMIQNPDAVNQLNTYLSYPLTNSISVDSGVTISCWVQIRKTPSSNERYVYTFNRGSNNPGLYLAYNASNNFYVVLNNGTNAYVPSYPTVSLNTWYNAIVVINNGTVSYYVNGTSYNAATYTPPSGVTLQTNFILGGSTNSAYEGNFIIDDLRIYNTALTAAQVSSIYNQQGVPGRSAITNSIGSVKTVLTGTPLFSQLSTSATSSAVGAFSLRAVNGSTAKAVAVQAHPVVAYPPASLTSNTTTLTAQTYGNGLYTTVASSYNSGGGIYEAWRAFTAVSNWWRPADSNYNNTTGLYTGTAQVTVSGGVNYYGDWLQIQLPNKIRLVRYTLDEAPVIAGGQLNSTPLKFYVFGSSDSGTTWTMIDAQDVPVYLTQTFTVPSANAITTYDWFRLSVNKIPPSTTTLRVAKWILNGSADNYATGSATDFYADRLGNLLTAPVVGQSLASWLGGATGYVTTWYDQSGAGNHATQATAANQPIITKATKGPGYACVYTGNQWVSFGTLNTFTGTPFCISAVTTRTSNVSLNGITGWGDGFSGFNFAIFTLSATQDRFRSDFRKTTGLNASGAIPVYAAGEGALYPVCDYSSGFINRIYNKSSLLTTSGNGVDFLNTANTKTPSIGLAPASAPNCFYQGEIYEVIFFTKSLYDLDGTSTITQIYNNQVGIYGT